MFGAMNLLTIVTEKNLDKGVVDSNDENTMDKKILEIYYKDVFNDPIEDEEFPDSLEYIEFGKNFNQPIENVKWPKNLTHIHFGDNFNQPIENVKWPNTLKSIEFTDRFNQPIENVKWPESLKEIYFGKNFTHPLKSNWPPSLNTIDTIDCCRDEYDEDDVDELLNK